MKEGTKKVFASDVVYVYKKPQAASNLGKVFTTTKSQRRATREMEDKKMVLEH